jgi:hypothetical protein
MRKGFMRWKETKRNSQPKECAKKSAERAA